MDKTLLRSHFVKAQHNFDKELRKAKRKYTLKDAQSIYISKNHNTSCFWSSINSLKPKRAFDIPIGVYINDQLTTELDLVVDQWLTESLYNTNCTNSKKYNRYCFISY